jgi:hypothetical protein
MPPEGLHCQIPDFAPVMKEYLTDFQNNKRLKPFYAMFGSTYSFFSL